MRYKTIIEGGYKRKAIRHICKWCKSEYWARPRKRKYCSTKCRDNAKRLPTLELICLQCGKKFYRSIRRIKSKYQFCSRDCKDKAQRLEGISAIHPSHYNNGASSYKERALRHYGAVCSICGYKEYPAMLDAHHIGDPNNHELSNLSVQCVWCHALITRGVMKDNGAVAQFGRASPLQGEG